MKYDVAFSFADENREYVALVADALKARAVRVFYDSYEQSSLWGKDLYEHLDTVYRQAARFCVVFVSEPYANKLWTNRERRSAQARAFSESEEYILPARFDDTEIPGILPTVGYIDLRGTGPEVLADLICEKLQQVSFEPSGPEGASGFRWSAEGELNIGGRRASVRSFQHLPILVKAEPLVELTSNILERILKAARSAEGVTFWTHYQDRRFDRIYATTSVLTALHQLGADFSYPVIRRSVDYLRQSRPAVIDDRAATIFLLLIDELSDESLAEFLNTLSRLQLTDSDPAVQGSFIFPQGPSDDPVDTGSHWSSAPIHADGASFHACHIADTLLHIPHRLADRRAQAEPILDGVRDFLIRSFISHDGWLVNLNGHRTPLTLYGYALCPALHIPLPTRWREIGAECLRMSSGLPHNSPARMFAVMNAVYAARSIPDDDFRRTATEFVGHQFAALPGEDGLDRLQTRDLGVLLRALAYGVELLDDRFVSSMGVAAAYALAAWE